MRNRLDRQLRTHTGPNMTPMVDIVMCILIFFMIASSLVPEFLLASPLLAAPTTTDVRQRVNVPPPPARAEIEIKKDGQDIWVAAFGNVMKMDRPGAGANEAILALFESKKAGLSDDVQIIIRPQRLVRYQDVVTIYDFCIKARFRQVTFAPAR